MNRRTKIIIIIILKLDPRATRGQSGLLTQVKIRIKIIIIIVLKPESKLGLRSGPSHGSGWPLIQVNVRIKVVIIIVFKPDLKVNPARLGSRVKLTIDPSQRDNKNDYYHSLKPNSVVDPGPGSGHMSCWLLIQVNIRIKIIIIIILKLNSIVDLRQNPGREPGPLTWVNLEVDLVRLTQIQKQI